MLNVVQAFDRAPLRFKQHGLFDVVVEHTAPAFLLLHAGSAKRLGALQRLGDQRGQIVTLRHLPQLVKVRGFQRRLPLGGCTGGQIDKLFGCVHGFCSPFMALLILPPRRLTLCSTRRTG